MIELGALVLLGLLGLAVLCAVSVIVKAVLWVALLPFRLVLWLVGGLLLLPFLLFKFLLAGIIFVISLPVIIISMIAAAAAFVAAMLLPLAPVVLLVALIWYLVRPEPQALVRG
jgi:hypothetical protein